jgi:hypothetical protein
MVVEKPEESQGLSTRAASLAAGLATMRLDSNTDDSDDDLSEPDEDLTSQATDDTQVVSDLNVQGMAAFDETRCLVELSQKVKGHALLCGHLRASCSRRKHIAIQNQPGRRGQEGYYQELPNARGTANDAVADTFLSQEAWIERRQSNRVMLTQLGQEQSPGKALMDATMKPRGKPQVRIDTTPRGPRAAQLQAWAQVSPATPQAAAFPPALTATTPITTSAAATTGNPSQVAAAPLTVPTTGVTASTSATAGGSIPPAGGAVATKLSTAATGTTTTAAATTTALPATGVVIAATGAPSTGPASTVAPRSILTKTTAGLPTVAQPTAPAPAVSPPPPTPPAADPAMVLLLTRLVDRVDALNTSQQSVLATNEQMVQKLAEQTARLAQQEAELQKMRSAKPVQTTTTTAGPSGPPLGTISVPSSADGSKKKFYAVAKGRTIGVFIRWKDAEKSVHGYSGSIHKRFRNERTARDWLAERTGAPRMDDASEFSDDITQREDTVYGGHSRTAGQQSRPTSSVIDPRHSGPDPSVGKPNKIHNVSIQVESEVLELLCPKGVTAQTRRDLMDVTPDIMSLPGKLGASTADSSAIWDQFAGAVNEMAEQRAVRTGSQVRDTQWRGATRNALDKIRTMDDVFDAAEEIGSQSDKIMTSFEAGIQEILYAQGWSKDDVDLYVVSGLLPRITQRLLALYYELYLHFQKLIAHNPDPEHFKAFTMLHVEFHAKQRRQIRLYAVRRSQMILRSYTYLRDARAKGFTDIRLVGQVTQKLQDMTRQLTDLQSHIERPSLRASKEWSCAHCHSELHTGGMAACPLNDFKAKVARRVAKEAAKTFKDDPDVLARLMAEERKKDKE